MMTWSDSGSYDLQPRLSETVADMRNGMEVSSTGFFLCAPCAFSKVLRMEMSKYNHNINCIYAHITQQFGPVFSNSNT